MLFAKCHPRPNGPGGCHSGFRHRAGENTPYIKTQGLSGCSQHHAWLLATLPTAREANLQRQLLDTWRDSNTMMMMMMMTVALLWKKDSCLSLLLHTGVRLTKQIYQSLEIEEVLSSPPQELMMFIETTYHISC